MSRPDAAAVAPETVPTRSAAPTDITREPVVPKDSKRVVASRELPPAIRKSVAGINIAGFSYSEDPQARMVVINNRILHEGEEVLPGVKLERIGNDGIVLSHKGIRFRP